MTSPLPLVPVSLLSMWILFLVGLIFYREGDDKRTLIFSACTVIALLSMFALLIPTYSITSIPAYNVTYVNSTGNVIQIVEYPAINNTIISPPYSNPEITLYTIFAVFQAFIFFMFAIWSLRYRIQYKTLQEFEKGMKKNRKSSF